MATHTPEGASIVKFIEHENGSQGSWMVRVVDERKKPAVILEAWRDDEVEKQPAKSLEVHIDQIHLADDEIDEVTKSLIRGWLASL